MIIQRRVKISSCRNVRVVTIPTARKFPVRSEIAALSALTRQSVLVVEATLAVANIQALALGVFTRDSVRSTTTRNVLTARSNTRPAQKATASGPRRTQSAPMRLARTVSFLVTIRTRQNVHVGLALKEVEPGTMSHKSTHPVSRCSAPMAAQQLRTTTVLLPRASAGAVSPAAAHLVSQVARIRIALLSHAHRA